MTIEQKEWYKRNRNFLRTFESTPIFKEFRVQRNRVLRLNKVLEVENNILQKLASKMQKAKRNLKREWKE